MSFLPVHTSQTPYSVDRMAEILKPLEAPPAGENNGVENHFGWLSIYARMLVIECHDVSFSKMEEQELLTTIFKKYISSMIQHGFRVDLPFVMQNSTPLCMAAGCGCKIVARNLLEFGANVNSGIYETPLWWAAAKSQLAMVDFLILRGANIFKPNKVQQGHNELAIHIATNPDIIRLLVHRGAYVNATCNNPINFTALHWAVRCALPNTVEVLLDLGSEDIPNQQNETALMVAQKVRDKIYPLGIVSKDDDRVVKLRIEQIINLLKSQRPCQSQLKKRKAAPVDSFS